MYVTPGVLFLLGIVVGAGIALAVVVTVALNQSKKEDN